MARKKALYMDLIDGKLCHVYDHAGHKVVYFCDSKEIEIDGKMYPLNNALENQDEFYHFCVETDLF